MLQVLVELADPVLIDLRHVGMQQGRRLVGIGQPLGKLGLPSFKFFHVVDDRLDWPTGFQGRQELRQFTVGALQLALPPFQVGAALNPQPVHLPGELGAEFLEQLRFH
ncbi:hypothetical protein [Roseinatronobacter sp.]|uniref:hypothetical protein n=1 Tax=Roseinatronobacter sp. TaxID=1945755 RepID=UPI003F71B4C7